MPSYSRANTQNQFCVLKINFLSEDKSLWGTGYNEKGQLGIGNKHNQNTFQLIAKDVDIKLLACGKNFTIYSLGKENESFSQCNCHPPIFPFEISKRRHLCVWS